MLINGKIVVVLLQLQSQLVDLEIQNGQLKDALHKTEESESQRIIKMYNEDIQLLFNKYENLRVSWHIHCNSHKTVIFLEKMWRTTR